MSKQLYINNKRLVIDEEQTYFPFSYKINTLEDVSIIGVPVSKTVTIPRCSQNDEIFGFIGELTRKTVGYTDNYIGVSFNQIKKAVYTLYNNSELISTGLLVVTNLTKDSYEVMLSDIMIDKIETLGTKKLNEIDLYDNTDTIVNFRSTTANVKSRNDETKGFIPTINNKEFASTGTDLLCFEKYSPNKSLITTLPRECTPLDLESLKNYDVDWSSSLSNIIRSINHAGLTQVEVDSTLTDTFNEIYLKGNTLKNKEVITAGYLNAYNGSTSQIFVPYATTPSIPLRNGKYYLELGIDVKFQSSDNGVENDFLSKETIDGVTTSYHNGTLPDGGYMGTYYIKTRFVNKYTDGGITSSSMFLITGIPLYKNVNVTEIVTPNSSNGYIGSLRLQENIVIEHEYFPYIESNLNSVSLECSLSYTNPTNTVDKTYVLGTGTANGTQTYPVYVSFPYFKTKSSTFTLTTLEEFRTGDYVNGSTILPDISIKDYLLSVVKYLNLDIVVSGSNLKIVSKSYSKTSEVLILDSESTEINTNLIDFTSITYSAGLSDNPIIKTYETTNNKIYGEKVVNTGYNIKENKKDQKFDVSVPFLIVPVNNFSYDTFLKYFNGGYSKCSYGDVTGLNDKIVLGYPQMNQKRMSMFDDSIFETGGYTQGVTVQPIEKKFCIYNPNVSYDPSTTSLSVKYMMKATDPNLSQFYTFSPYKFSDIKNTVIVKSIEFNKPLTSYAFIKDSNYPESATIYNRFHKNQVTDKYNVNTHILKTKFYLDGLPNTRKIYNIKNSSYIISNLVEYDPTQPNMYDVELLKVNTESNYQIPYNDITINKNYISALPATNVAFTSVTFNGVIKNTYGETYNDPTVTEKGFIYSYYNPNPFIGEPNCVKVISSTVGAIFSSNLSSMIDGYPIKYKAYIITPLGTTYSNIVSFNLMAGGNPTLPRCVASNIDYFSFTCSGDITSLNGLDLIEKGIVYSSSTSQPLVDADDSITIRVVPDGNLNISVTVSGLVDNTTYYMNTFAVNEYGLGYGNVYPVVGVPNYFYTSATLPDYIPVVSWYMVTEPFTDTLWSIKNTEITVPVRYILGNDGRTISTFGAVYSTSDTTPNSGWATNSSSVAFMGRTDYKGATLTGLSSTTTYYIYAYGIDNTGEWRFGYRMVATTVAITNTLSVITTLNSLNPTSAIDVKLVSSTSNSVPVSYGYYRSTDILFNAYTKYVCTQMYDPNAVTIMTSPNLLAGVTYYFASYELYSSGEKRVSPIVSKSTGAGTGSYMTKTTTTYWDVYNPLQGQSYLACTKDAKNIDTLGLVNSTTGIFGVLPPSLHNKPITITPKCRFFGRLYFNDLVVKPYDRQSYGVYNHNIVFKFWDLFYNGVQNTYIDDPTGNFTVPLKSQQSLPHNIIYWIGAGNNWIDIMDKNLINGDWEINYVGTPYNTSFGTSTRVSNTVNLSSPSFIGSTINFQEVTSMNWNGITTPTGSEQTSVASFKELKYQKHPYVDAIFNFTIDA